jgi:hypothetical protein
VRLRKGLATGLGRDDKPIRIIAYTSRVVI